MTATKKPERVSARQGQLDELSPEQRESFKASAHFAIAVFKDAAEESGVRMFFDVYVLDTADCYTVLDENSVLLFPKRSLVYGEHPYTDQTRRLIRNTVESWDGQDDDDDENGGQRREIS